MSHINFILSQSHHPSLLSHQPAFLTCLASAIDRDPRKSHTENGFLGKETRYINTNLVGGGGLMETFT